MGRKKQRVRWTSVEDQFFVKRSSEDDRRFITRYPESRQSETRFKDHETENRQEKEYRPWRSHFQPRRNFEGRNFDRPATAFAPRFERQARFERRPWSHQRIVSESDSNVPDGFAKVCSKNLDVLFKKNLYVQRSQNGSITSQSDAIADLKDMEGEEEDASSMIEKPDTETGNETTVEASNQTSGHETDASRSAKLFNRDASPFYPSSFFTPPQFHGQGPTPGSGASLYLYNPATNVMVPCEEIVLPRPVLNSETTNGFFNGPSKIYLSFPYPTPTNGGGMISPSGASPHEIPQCYGGLVPYPIAAPNSTSGSGSSPPIDPEETPVFGSDDFKQGSSDSATSLSPSADLSYYAPEKWSQQDMFFETDWYDEQTDPEPVYFGDQPTVIGENQVCYFRKPFYMNGIRHEPLPQFEVQASPPAFEEPVEQAADISETQVQDVAEDSTNKTLIPGLPMSYADMAAAGQKKKSRKKRSTTPTDLQLSEQATVEEWYPPPETVKVVEPEPPKSSINLERFSRKKSDQKSGKSFKQKTAPLASLKLDDKPETSIKPISDDHEWEAIPNELKQPLGSNNSLWKNQATSRKNRKTFKSVQKPETIPEEERLPEIQCPSPIPEESSDQVTSGQSNPTTPDPELENLTPEVKQEQEEPKPLKPRQPRKKRQNYEDSKSNPVRPVLVQDCVDDLLAEVEQIQRRVVISLSEDIKPSNNAFLVKDIGLDKLLHGPMAFGRLRSSSVSSTLTTSELLSQYL